MDSLKQCSINFIRDTTDMFLAKKYRSGSLLIPGLLDLSRIHTAFFGKIDRMFDHYCQDAILIQKAANVENRLSAIISEAQKIWSCYKNGKFTAKQF
jgi:hypothetical protein